MRPRRLDRAREAARSRGFAGGSGAYSPAEAEVVAGFGGYVAKYKGDGVIAYFGQF
jgi:class 3 adenylate cyclase